MKTYTENRTESLLWSLLVSTPILAVVLYRSFNTPEFTYVLLGCVLTIILILIVLYSYPKTSLTLSEEKLTYKKGGKEMISAWSDVLTISYQKNGLGDVINPASFFIDTKNGSTGLIDLRTIKDGSRLIEHLERLSGKKMMIGDLSTKIYQPYVR